jgi:hypothetical protein
LGKPEIQRIISSNLDGVGDKFYEFLESIIPFLQQPNFHAFLQSYKSLNYLISSFRFACVYEDKKNNDCLEATQKLRLKLKEMDQFFLKHLADIPAQTRAGEDTSYVHSLGFSILFYNVSGEIPVIDNDLYHREKKLWASHQQHSSNAEAEKLYLITNKLINLKKNLRNSLLSFAPKLMRPEMENFWFFYLEVMQERTNVHDRQDYWTINLFQLNIKVNEFFYGCERNKVILSKNTYQICEALHTQWNQILRSTLKF